MKLLVVVVAVVDVVGLCAALEVAAFGVSAFDLFYIERTLLLLIDFIKICELVGRLVDGRPVDRTFRLLIERRG